MTNDVKLTYLKPLVTGKAETTFCDGFAKSELAFSVRFLWSHSCERSFR